MAMICVKGGRECTGCMACQQEPQRIDKCCVCGEPVFDNECYYDVDGQIFHDGCEFDFLLQYKKGVA